MYVLQIMVLFGKAAVNIDNISWFLAAGEFVSIASKQKLAYQYVSSEWKIQDGLFDSTSIDFTSAP